MPQITDVVGIKVGHAADVRAVTGCTVILCERGAVGGVDVRGSAPGTRETDALRPMNLVERVHGVLLTGGSAFGLAAADGVMRFLEERGIGTWAVRLPGDVLVGALVVVNAYGDVRDDHSGQVLAGARDRATGRFLNMAQALMSGGGSARFGANTTLAVVATNAALTKEQTNKLAQLGHDGLARVISPAHTMYDGDTVFALSTGDARAEMIPLGTAAVEVVAEAVQRAVRLAKGLGGIPGLADG